MRGRLGRNELDRIAAAVAAAPADPHYPQAADRLKLRHVTEWPGGVLCVPKGPWSVAGHPHRAGAPLQDPAALQVLSTRWTAAGGTVDQYGQPVHPYWRDLLGDPRIGLPTDLGVLWRRGPNQTCDALLVREGPAGPEVLLIERRDSGDLALPGGFRNPGEDAATAALRELAEETGLRPPTARARVIWELIPTGALATLHAWTSNSLVLIEAEPGYLAGAVPIADDDAVGAEWFPAAGLHTLRLAERHLGYIRRGLVAWRVATVPLAVAQIRMPRAGERRNRLLRAVHRRS